MKERKKANTKIEMSKKEQVLILEPSAELRFRGPFTDVVTSSLKLTNPSDRRVFFKVKTTAPKRYCVRPNNGTVEPKSSVNVAVMLQPFDYDPSEKNKHKFMVQTMFAPADDVVQENVWKDANPENLMDSKLKCVFELPNDGATQNNVDSTLTVPDERSHVAKTVEVVKFSPKSTSAENEMKRTAEELKRIEQENTNLRHEMIQLKEEGLRLRRMQQNASSQGGASETHGGLSPTYQAYSSVDGGANQQTLMPYVIVAVIAAVLGLILGKIF